MVSPVRWYDLVNSSLLLGGGGQEFSSSSVLIVVENDKGRLLLGKALTFDACMLGAKKKLGWQLDCLVFPPRATLPLAKEEEDTHNRPVVCQSFIRSFVVKKGQKCVGYLSYPCRIFLLGIDRVG